MAYRARARQIDYLLELVSKHLLSLPKEEMFVLRRARDLMRFHAANHERNFYTVVTPETQQLIFKAVSLIRICEGNVEDGTKQTNFNQ